MITVLKGGSYLQQLENDLKPNKNNLVGLSAAAQQAADDQSDSTLAEVELLSP